MVMLILRKSSYIHFYLLKFNLNLPFLPTYVSVESTKGAMYSPSRLSIAIKSLIMSTFQKWIELVIKYTQIGCYLRNDIVQSVKIYLDEGSAKGICKRVHIIVLILALPQYQGRVLTPEECHHCLKPTKYTKYNQSYESYLTIKL